MAKKGKKGKIRSTMGWLFKPFVNVSSWISLSILKTTTVGVAETIKNAFSLPATRQAEDFETAVSRLHLSPDDLLKQQRLFMKFAFVFLLFAVLGILYTLYLLWFAHFTAGIFSLAISGIFASYAFRFHFWSFQIKHKRLGCTFKDWMNAKVSGEKSG